jgi:hypothetical protein
MRNASTTGIQIGSESIGTTRLIPFPGKLGLKSAIAELEANRRDAMREATL